MHAPATRLFSPSFVRATAGNLLFFIGVTTFFVLPVHIEDLGGSRADVGHIMGMWGVASVFGILATGVLADRFGRKRFMVAGALLWAAVAYGFSMVETLGPAIYLLRMGQGLAFSLAFVATNALIVDLAPPGALGRAIAVFGTTTLATHAVGPALGEWILGHGGFRVLAWTSAGAGVLACAIFSTFPERIVKQSELVPGPGLVALAFRRGAWGALFAAVGSSLAFGAAMSFIPVFVRSRSLGSFAPFFVAYVIAAICVRLLAGGLGDRVGHRLIAGMALAVFSASVGAIGLVFSVVALAATGLVFGAAHGFVYPSLNALFLDGVPVSRRGSAMALFNLAFNGGVMVAAFIGGEIAERFGYSTLWYGAGVCAAAGVGLLSCDRA